MSEERQYDRVIWRKGKQVILRPFEESDLAYFQRWINDPETNRFLNVTWPMTMKAEKDWFERVAKFDPNYPHLTICTHAGEVVGNTGMNIDLVKQSASTGTVIGPREHRGKGFATDAKMLMLDYAFNWRGLRKVTSCIFSFNEPSQKYAARCGYRHMATIEREHFRKGKWVDEVQYVVFREEWLTLWEKYKEGWTPPWEVFES